LLFAYPFRDLLGIDVHEDAARHLESVPIVVVSVWSTRDPRFV
jgi:hypothetical protein